MQENNNEGENEIINEESKPIIDQNKINNPPLKIMKTMKIINQKILPFLL